MVGALWLLWIADAPILDQLELDEALLDAKLALILIKLVHVVEKTPTAACTSTGCCRVLLFQNIGHAHTNSIWADIACAKYRLVLLAGEEVFAFVRGDGRDVDVRSLAVD